MNTTIPVISVASWIVIQQRLDDSNAFDFNLTWPDYKSGFGVYNRNFWIGLDNINQLVSSGNYMLRFELLVPLRIGFGWFSAEYTTVSVANEIQNYALTVTGYSGDMGDILNTPDLWNKHVNVPFSTSEMDNDGTQYNCAGYFGGGWWYSSYYCGGTFIHALWNLNTASGVVNGFSVYPNYIQQVPLAASRIMIKSKF